MQQKAEVTQGQHLPIYRCQTACQVSLFVRFLISWISLPTKTTKIGTPRIKVISQYEKRKCLKSAQCNVPIQYKCSLIILESHLISDVYDTVSVQIFAYMLKLYTWHCESALQKFYYIALAYLLFNAMSHYTHWTHLQPSHFYT